MTHWSKMAAVHAGLLTMALTLRPLVQFPRGLLMYMLCILAVLGLMAPSCNADVNLSLCDTTDGPMLPGCGGETISPPASLPPSSSTLGIQVQSGTAMAFSRLVSEFVVIVARARSICVDATASCSYIIISVWSRACSHLV